MLKTLEKETGKTLTLESELFAKSGLNTVLFKLKGEEDDAYILAIAYDSFGKSAIEKSKTAIWKGELFGLCSALFPFSKRILSSIKGSTKPCAKEFSGEYEPAFSLCRFDELYPKYDNKKLIITEEDSSTILPFYIKEDTAVLGTWMCPISRAGLLAAVEYIFENYKQIKNIEYKNTPFSVLLDRGWRHNDFFLKLPKTADELRKGMTQKSRYNLKRERRIIEEKFGGLTLENIKLENITSKVVDKFYEFKGATHEITKKDYDILKLPLTDYYLLKTGDGEIRAIALSCEQGDKVFIENHTFDSNFREYSFGKQLYEMYIEALIEKGKTGLALAGGSLDYKNRYGTFCATVYSGTITRKSYNIYKKLSKFGLGKKPISIRRWTERLSK